MNKSAPEFVLEWEFSAPREMVWKAWTEESILSEWYGPGVETITHKLDVRNGGQWLLEFRFGENSSFQRADYTRVDSPDRLDFILSTADAEWNIAANQMMPNWPRSMQTCITLASSDTGTMLRLAWTPHEATEEENDAFAAVMDKMGNNWSAGMKKIAEILGRNGD